MNIEMDLKRKATDGAMVPFKKPRNELVATNTAQSGAVVQAVS